MTSNVATAQETRPRAFITGATSGLGREFARQLSTLGYDLTVVARDKERLLALASELESAHGIDVTVLSADLSQDADTARVVDHLGAHPVDVLVNNAGFGHAGRIGLIAAEAQDAMVRLHVLAVHRLTQAALPAMLTRRSGSVIMVSSIASFLTSAGNVNYCATKAYDRLFAEGLALEAGPHGVYVQALCPGFTHTELHQRAGLPKRAPPWMWLSADRVVAASLGAMHARKPTVVIPGWFYRFMAFVLRYSPRWLLTLEARLYRRDR
ncbi:MAG: SDR family NAD(P)-dependent oxidoreductase [Gemmatimonadaceae bacterium]